jgi:hypothetical protein
MSLNISQYVDPGVYIGQVIVPGSVTVNTVPLTVALVGTGNRNKRVTNEAVTRGLVQNETLAVASTPGAHNATLINVSNRQPAQTTLLSNGTALSTAQWSFLSATVTGSGAGPFNFTSNNLFSLALDGLTPVTIQITSGGSNVTTITNDLIQQQMAGVTISALTTANVASGINLALAGASSLGYGPAYGAVASTAGGFVVLTSPLATSQSDARLYQAYPAANDQTNAIFGVTLPFQASTVVQVVNSAYNSLNVYTANYTSTNTTMDALQQSPVQTIVRVGNFAGVTSYVLGTDFQLTGNNLDYSIDTAAVFTSSISAANFNVSVNNTILVAFDGRAAVSVLLNGLGSPPPGYANPGTPSAALPSELANNINAVVANSTVYGPQYRNVCTVSGGTKLVLTSPNVGAGSSVQLAAPTTLSAVTALFGLTAQQLPFTQFGVGARPVPGAIYFATYEYTRPTADFNLPKQYFSPSDFLADFGQPVATNQLALAAKLCFANKAPSLIGVQVNDATSPGTPTITEVTNALNAAGASTVATEICVLDTRLQVQAALVQFVTNQSSPTQKQYCRGWFGMPRGTVIGDSTTPGSWVYAATNTLQVPGDSPGRGRLVLAAPSNVSFTTQDEKGNQFTALLDGSYVAATIASVMTSFTSPSDSLLRKTIVGFDVSTFPTFLKAQRGTLASNGVCVVTLTGGNLVLTDPMTTEAGGGKLVIFEEISASTQTDAVTSAVTTVVDSNLVGIVPSDLSQFIATVKGYVGGALRSMIASGAIGPFKNSAGVSRDIDFSSDIQVFQDANDPTKFNFNYFFNLKLPAKRFFGQYSVNNPFF